MFNRPKSWPDVPFPELRRRARILVVDDQDFPYAELFRDAGYLVDVWRDVENVADLEGTSFDLILLDVQGIGTQHSKEQGLGVLKHIKQTNPAQLTIAYSNADYDLSFQPFFGLADHTLPKTADYFEFKREVDRLLRRRFSLEFYVERMEAELASYEVPKPELRKQARKAILARDSRGFERWARRRNIEGPGFERAVQVCQAAIGVANVVATLAM